MSVRRTRSLLAVVAALAMVVLGLGFAGAARAEGSPWVRSDLPDYAPGSTVTLTAGGFDPLESVRVVVNDDQGRSWSHTADVAADTTGGFTHSFTLPEWFVAIYAVTATASSGTAVTSFTDGNISLSIAPAGVKADVRIERFNRSDSCAGSPSSNVDETHDDSPSNVGGGAGSIRLTADATDGSGARSFAGWVVDGGALNPSPSICVAAPGGTNVATVATYGAPAPGNTAPVAANDAWPVLEDSTLTVAAPGVLGNDSDADSDPVTATLVAGPAHGSLTLGADGSFSYTPAANHHGPDSFTYRAGDGAATSDVATVALAVTPVNDAPVAHDDSATTDEDTAVLVDVLANDGDVDGDPLSVVAGSLAVTNGTAELVTEGPDAGRVRFAPAADHHGTAGFTYRVTDGAAESATATVTITVDLVNDAPVAADDATTMEEDGSGSIDVLVNDSDTEGDSLEVTATGPAGHGTVTIGADGTVRYVPAADYNGTDSFDYTVEDGNGGSDSATVTVTVTAVNDAPTLDAVGDLQVAEDSGAVTVDLAGITAGPLNESGQALTVSATSDDQSLLGDPTVTYTSDRSTGSLTFTPEPDRYGTALVTVTVSDDGGTEDGGDDTAQRSFRVTVTPVNDAPVADDDAATTAEDTAVVVEVLPGDSDVDGDALSVTGSGDGAAGSTVVNPDGTVTYTPDTDFFGTDSFTYTVCDDHGTTPGDDQLCDTATVTVTVTPVNDAPVVIGGADRTTTEGFPIVLDATFTDVDAVDGEAFTATVDWGDGSPAESATVTGNTVSATHTYADDELGGDDVFHATITVTDGGTTDGAADPLSGSDTVAVGVANVAPAVTAPAVTVDPATGVVSLATAFSDPAGALDAPYTGSFTVDGQSVPGTVSGTTMTGSTRLAPGCHTFATTATVTDGDGGTGTSGVTGTTAADVYLASFQAPIKDNARNIAKFGNVVPIKVQLASSCRAGATVTDVPLYLTIAQGGDAVLDDSVSDTAVVTESVSNADSGTRMRVSGSGYVYNLATKGTGWVAGNEYTLRVRAGSAGGPIILRALFQPKR